MRLFSELILGFLMQLVVELINTAIEFLLADIPYTLSEIILQRLPLRFPVIASFFENFKLHNIEETN